MGVCGWQDDYECLPDGSVVCRLRLRIGDDRVVKGDGRPAAWGLCEPGELVRHVVGAGVKAGHPQELAAWTGAAIKLAAAEAKAFEARLASQCKDRQKQTT